MPDPRSGECVLMVTIGVVTLGKSKLQERGGRWLKLLSGLVVTGIGILLLVRPHWLGF
jgi:ABC-type nickel/cobalt efflux system permease component RcnA